MAALPPSRDGMFDPIPHKPAIISIFADQTLRRGDAVMMRDGLRVFGGRETGPHQPADFMRLTHAPSLEWHLRRTLSAFDNNPPDHWHS